MKLLEGIGRHLPNSSIGSLALVSKKLGTHFRFLHVHSGQEPYSIQKFSLIANEPQLGHFTTNIIVHPTFYRPPVKVQWLFEGANPHAAAATCCLTEGYKQQLVARTLQACP